MNAIEKKIAEAEAEGKLYYKVISKNRYSAFLKNRVFRVHYPFNTWAIPRVKGSRLSVFSSKISAERWMNVGEWKGRNLICVPCLVKNPFKADFGIPLIPVNSWNVDIQTKILRAFWVAFNKYGKRFGIRKNMGKVISFMKKDKGVLVRCAHGAGILCDAVKCLG